MLDGNAPAIFILGRVLRDGAVEVADLHSYLAPAGDDCFVMARQSVTLLVAGANTERAALAEQQRTQFLLLLRSREYRKQRAWPVLFHLHRRGENIQRAFRKREIDDVADELRVEIVEVRFQDRDLLLGKTWLGIAGVEHCSLRFADAEPQHVGTAGKVAPSGAVADLFGGHHGPWSEA